MLKYRTRSKDGSKKISVKLPTGIYHGIEELKRLFHSRYPEEVFPTLSSVFEALLARSLKDLRDPKRLDAELRDFRLRYAAVTSSRKEGETRQTSKAT